MTHLPLQLRVGERHCVVVGGGRVATRRVLQLLAHRAHVRVVSPEVSATIDELAAEGAVELHVRPATEDDLDGAFLVVLCTDDPELHDRLAEATAAFVTRADGVECGLSWMAERPVGPVHLAVGTDGRAPAVAAWVADRLASAAEEELGADAATLERLVDLVEEVRHEAPAGSPEDDPPRLNWRSVLDRSMLELIRSGRTAEAKERLKACRSSS
jgi:siroheme synthase-like protein